MGKITINGQVIEVEGDVNITSENGNFTVSQRNGSNIFNTKFSYGTTVNLNIEGVVASIKADGSVTAQDVNGDVSAGGSFKGGNIAGNVSAGGSVTARDVGGNLSAGGSVKINKV